MTNKPKGRLIVIEGLDGSGKETQTKLLFEKMAGKGLNVRKIQFPRYDNPSSALIKMYLNGDFGGKAGDISPYVASTFYAVDRYASFKQDWEAFYRDGGVVLADRYTTSNFVHQAGKITDSAERDQFLEWLWDFEYRLYALPVPDLVFFLNVAPEFNEKLMLDRNNKFTGKSGKDIHERDASHLRESYENAIQLVDRYGWQKIECVKAGQLRSIDDINNEIVELATHDLHKEI